MPATIVIGTQWGDEGKGKVVDLLAADADLVVRFHGSKTFPPHRAAATSSSSAPNGATKARARSWTG